MICSVSDHGRGTPRVTNGADTTLSFFRIRADAVFAQVRTLRQQVKDAKKAFDKTEDDLKALQSVGQIIGEVLRQLDSEKCTCPVLPLCFEPVTAADPLPSLLS